MSLAAKPSKKQRSTAFRTPEILAAGAAKGTIDLYSQGRQGLGFLSLGLGALQVVLDKKEREEGMTQEQGNSPFWRDSWGHRGE